MWPFKTKLAPEPKWRDYWEKVGNCPRCGAPVYEVVMWRRNSRGRGLGYSETRFHDPNRINYTCDCKRRMDELGSTSVVYSTQEASDKLV